MRTLGGSTVSHLTQRLQELVQHLPVAHPTLGLPALTHWAASHPALKDESAFMHSHCQLVCLLAVCLVDQELVIKQLVEQRVRQP